jgi:subtilisin family serine protease
VGADGRRLVAPWIDLLAPGVSVLAPYLEGTVTVTDVNATSRTESFEGWATWSGTSFAAAAVSGALAALTIPGRRTATEALRQLRNPVDETVRRSFAISLP